MKDFEFPSEHDYTDEFPNESDAIAVQQKKRAVARRRRKIRRLNMLWFLVVAGLVFGYFYCTNFPDEEYIPQPYGYNYPPLVVAVIQNDIHTMRELAELGADINVTFGALDSTPLHRAAEFSSPQMVDELISWGADIYAENRNRQTPLHRAVYNHNARTLEALIYHAQDIEPREINDWTPLHHAAQHGNAAAVGLLLNSGAYINVQTSDGWTPLRLAENARRAEVIELLESLTD